MNRLNQKPGVQGTLLLSRRDGAIVRILGPLFNKGPVDGEIEAPKKDNNAERESQDKGSTQNQQQQQRNMAEDVARMVMRFVDAASAMGKDLDAEDDIKLLRMRTKRREYVIVPSMWLWF